MLKSIILRCIFASSLLFSFAWAGDCPKVLEALDPTDQLSLSDYISKQVYVPTFSDLESDIIGFHFHMRPFEEHKSLVVLLNKVMEPNRSINEIEEAKVLVESELRNYYRESTFPYAHRNYEYIYRILNERYVREFISELNQYSVAKNNEERTIPQDDLEKILAGYYTKIGFKKFWGRSRYDAKVVLEVAQSLKNSFADVLHELESELTIYGSFPNGKANLKQSDIDIHLGNKFEGLYYKEYDRPDINESLSRGMHPRGNKLGEIFHPKLSSFKRMMRDAENDVAKILHRHFMTYGSLLTIMPETGDPGIFYNEKRISSLGPIMLVVDSTGIKIKIQDTFSEDARPKIYEIIP